MRASTAPQPLAEETTPGEEQPAIAPMAQAEHEDQSEELLLDEVVEEPPMADLEPEATEPEEALEPEAEAEPDLSSELPEFGVRNEEAELSFDNMEPTGDEPEPAFGEPDPAFEEPEPEVESLEEESDDVMDLADLKNMTVQGSPAQDADQSDEVVRGTQHGFPANMDDDEPGFTQTPPPDRPQSESPSFNDFDDGGFVVPESAPSIDTPPLQEHSQPELAPPQQPAAEIPGLEASVEPIDDFADQMPDDAIPPKKSGGTLLMIGLILLVLAIAGGVAVAFNMGLIQL